MEAPEELRPLARKAEDLGKRAAAQLRAQGAEAYLAAAA